MSTTLKINIAILALLGTFLGGMYYGSRQSSETKTKEKETTSKDITTVIKEISRPDGTKETNTTIVDRSKEKREETSQQIIVPKKTLSVSALIGVNNSNFSAPIYGVSITKDFCGPITAGVWGLNNGTAGVSIGVRF